MNNEEQRINNSLISLRSRLNKEHPLYEEYVEQMRMESTSRKRAMELLDVIFNDTNEMMYKMIRGK